MSDSNAANDKSFWGHLDDLRKVLFRMVVVLVVFMAGFFFCMPWIFDHVILAPCNGDFVLYRLFARITSGIPGLSQFSTADFHVDLINIRLTTQFFHAFERDILVVACLRFSCVALFALGIYPSGTLRAGSSRGACRILFWRVDVLCRRSRQLFPCFSHHIAVSLFLRAEARPSTTHCRWTRI